MCIGPFVCRPRWTLSGQPDGQPEPLRSYAVGDAVDVLVNSLHWEGVVSAVRQHPPETVYVTCARTAFFLFVNARRRKLRPMLRHIRMSLRRGRICFDLSSVLFVSLFLLWREANA